MPNEPYNPACAHRHMGPWAVKPDWFTKMVELYRADRLPVLRVSAGDSEAEPPPAYEVENGVAVVPIIGQMIKGDSKFGGANSVRVRKAVRDAANDDAAKAIVLRIDSPGGSVAGTQELADTVLTVRARKPVAAYVEDLAASAAYWVAAQTESISMNPTGEAGSIGVFAVVEDTSGRAERLGIKVHVISTGKLKGAFVDGAPVTEGMLDYVREQVDEINEMFLSAVAAGRRMDLDSVRALADGRTFIGTKARDAGLVDRIESFDAFMGRMMERAQRSSAPARPRGRMVALARRRL